MKRIIALLTTLLLMLGMFSACTNTDGNVSTTDNGVVNGTNNRSGNDSDMFDLPDLSTDETGSSRSTAGTGSQGGRR